MSYNLESSKRKLSRLLDAISESPRIPVASRTMISGQQADPDSSPPTKRLKRTPNRDHLGGLAGALVRNDSTSTLRQANDRHISGAGSGPILAKDKMIKTSAGDTVAPFNPSSRRDFLFRLKTFSYPTPLNWSSKPDEINEVEWAKHGWMCHDKEEVECLCCRESIKVVYSELDLQSNETDEELPEDERQSLVKATVDKIAKNLIDGHSSSCSWRSKTCDGTDTLRLKIQQC
jgi:C3HC zinc finger-like